MEGVAFVVLLKSGAGIGVFDVESAVKVAVVVVLVVVVVVVAALGVE